MATNVVASTPSGNQLNDRPIKQPTKQPTNQQNKQLTKQASKQASNHPASSTGKPRVQQIISTASIEGLLASCFMSLICHRLATPPPSSHRAPRRGQTYIYVFLCLSHVPSFILCAFFLSSFFSCVSILSSWNYGGNRESGRGEMP